MAYETQSTDNDQKSSTSLGARLRTAREELGLERKDVAAQLRLNEKIILMMEKERYPGDLPVTFIRGYIRAYGKFLQIPDFEIKNAVDNIKIKSIPSPNVPTLKPYKIDDEQSGNFFVQLFTGLIILSMIGLVGAWYYSQYSPAKNQNNSQELVPNEPPAPTVVNNPPASATIPEREATPAKEKSAPIVESNSKPSNELANKRDAHQNTSSNTKSSVPAYMLSEKQASQNKQKVVVEEIEEPEITGLYAD